MPQLQDQLLALMPAGLKAFIDGSSRRDLLRKIDASLLVFNNQVAHLESGAVAEFQPAASSLDPALLAQACKALLGDKAKECSLLLLLPPVYFIATQQKMPGINSESIVSALTLQTENLLPANDSPVTLAVNPRITEFSDEPTALWMRSSTLAELYAAFAEQGLFVAAIRPRVLSVATPGSRLLDSDALTITLIETNENVLLRWLQISQADLVQAEFAEQWQQAITDESESTSVEFNSLQDYLAAFDLHSHVDYSFFPSGALNARKQVEKGRKLMMAAGVFMAALFLASIPFLIQSFQFRSLAATLEAQRQLSFDARQDQAVVVSFENELGPISDFPEQHVPEAMFNLQNALTPNRLSTLEITEGLINIQGTSQEPQAILQRLEMDPMFTEVAFSRATNNDRYYISLRLSTVNFDAYMVRYFPDE